MQDFVLPCYPTSHSKIQPVVAITLPVSSLWKVQRNFFSQLLQCEECNALRITSAQFRLLLLLVNSFTARQGFSQTPNAQTDTMILYPKRGTAEIFIPARASQHLKSQPNTTKVQKVSDFLEENAPSSSQCPDSLMQWAWSEEQGHPWEGEPGRHKLKHQIWTRGCDKCDPKHCFTSASHPFFFHWLLLTAALIRNSQEMLFKNIYTLKKALVFFPLCFLSHNVHALKDYHQNSQSLPSNSN